MTRRDQRALTFVAAALLALCAARAAAAGLTPQQLASIQSMTSAVISPDGSNIAAVRSVPRQLPDDENGPARSELVVIDVSDGRSRTFVTDEAGVRQVQWLPDGRSISFLATRDGDDHRALYVISVEGGEARRILAMESDISAYSWCQDGTRVAVIAEEPETEGERELKEKGFDQEVYEEDWRPRRVWLAEIGEGAADPRALELPGSAFQVGWDPAGERLAVAMAPRPLVDDRYMFQRVHIVNAADGLVSARIENPGKLGAISWSPDGRHLAMISGVDIHDPAPGSLLVAPATGGRPIDVTPGFEGMVEAVEWVDGESLVLLAAEGVSTSLYRVRRTGGVLERLGWDAGPAVMTGMTVSRDGRWAAFLGDSPTHPVEVFTARLGGEPPQRLTRSNPWLEEVELGVQEVVRFEARDGLELDGLLIKPVGFEKDRAYPLVLVVHGGPEAHYHDGWLTRYSRPGQVFAARGFAVFYPNYRGSTGRGVAFAKSSQEDPAGKEFDDLVDAIDHLVEIGLVDPKRVGVTGGSYGGYATAWCATRLSERFAAGVMFVGISDLISKAGTTDIPEEEFLVHAGRRPQDDFEFFVERSPVAHARGSRTPLLIAGGTADTRVDPGQSLELYRSLKTVGGAPVRLVRYPGEGHGNRKAAARLDYCLRLLRWMEHYLQGSGGDPPLPTLSYGLEGETDQ